MQNSEYTSNRFLTVRVCKEAINLLKIARENLPMKPSQFGRKSEFVCDQISHAAFSQQSGYCSTGPMHEAKTDLRVWIKELIEGEFSLRDYLRYHGQFTDETDLQRIRKDWITWMISELELKKQYLEKQNAT